MITIHPDLMEEIKRNYVIGLKLVISGYTGVMQEQE